MFVYIFSMEKRMETNAMHLRKDTPVKKVLTSLIVFIFIFSNAAAFAQMPVAVPGVVSSLEGFSKIGVVAAIQGKVEVMTPGAAGRMVESGEEIFIGDEVKTDALGHLQILLLDETVFTIGPNSAITIDKFIYDPGTHVGKMEANITKGVFRYVSGKIAANKPENVTIKLPTATIGIRGTIIAGEVTATGSMAMLMGPGSKNETGATIGSFVISGTGGNSGEQEHVTRTGFGVSVDQTGGLSGVFMVPEAKIQHLGEALLPAPPQGPAPVVGEGDQGPSGKSQPPANPAPGTVPGAPVAPGTPPPPVSPVSAPGVLPEVPAAGSDPAPVAPVTAPMTTGVFGADFNAGQTSGEQTYSGFQTTQTASIMGTLQNNLNQDTTTASQDAAHNSAVQNTPTQTVRDTLNRDMFTRIATAVVPYQQQFANSNFNFNGLLGSLNATINVDFNSHQVIGGNVRINVPDGINTGTALMDQCALNPQPFDTNTTHSLDPAIFKWTGAQIIQGGPPNFDSMGIFNQVIIQFQDVTKTAADGSTQVDLAAQAKVTVDYTRPNSPTPDTGHGEVIAPQP
jgi:hypothetical protein